jgi:hypothetical protein
LNANALLSCLCQSSQITALSEVKTQGQVADMYAPDAVLLPTVSNTERTNRTGVVNYFTSFLKMKPQGTIVKQGMSTPSSMRTMNSGDYVFTVMRDGKEEKMAARLTRMYSKASSVPEQAPTKAEVRIPTAVCR